FDYPGSDIILRSCDFQDCHVPKIDIANSSSVLRELVQTVSITSGVDNGEEEALPVVKLPESRAILHSLLTFIFPVAPVLPSSTEDTMKLLSVVAQKYKMNSVLTYRCSVKLGSFPAPFEAESFSAYSNASRMELVPEMESAARLTLGYPMTFESIGEALQSFERRALCDLVRYRKRCRDSLLSCFDSFFSVRSRHQIWASCREPFRPNSVTANVQDPPTALLGRFFTGKSVKLNNGFTHAISSSSTILEEYWPSGWLSRIAIQ
ncbi:hypothetical protein V8E53_000022, partial [Lactarius tabidus]